MKLIVCSEYIFYDPKKSEINIIVKVSIRKYNQKYGDNPCREIDIKSNVKFLDKLTNKTKNRTINRCNIKKSNSIQW